MFVLEIYVLHLDAMYSSSGSGPLHKLANPSMYT